MKTYIYRFADGMTSAVEVEDSLYDLLTELDRQERYGARRETRRHVSMEMLVEKGVEPTVMDEYFIDDAFGNMDNENLQKGIFKLLPTQRDLLHRRFAQGQTVTEIAEEDGIAVCSVSKKLGRIYKKLDNFL